MKQYFLWLKLNQPKNKAQKQVQEFAEQMDNCLMDESGLKNFINMLDARINEINAVTVNCMLSWRTNINNINLKT